jgi:hypothetical protein
MAVGRADTDRIYDKHILPTLRAAGINAVFFRSLAQISTAPREAHSLEQEISVPLQHAVVLGLQEALLLATRLTQSVNLLFYLL